jgi:uncharacterized protein YndB with AHSA1/START domain
MIKVEIAIDIDRPVDEVFAYLVDAHNVPDWFSPVQEVKQADPPGVGAKATLVARFLGRRIEAEHEMTEYEPNRRFAFKTEKPFKLTGSTTFSPRGRGTRVVDVVEAEFGTFFRLAEPLAGAVLKRQRETDYANLKTLLEAGTAASSASK